MSVVEFFQKNTVDSKTKETTINTKIKSSIEVLKDIVPNPAFVYRNPFLFKIFFAKNEEITIRKINTFLKLASLDLTTALDVSKFVLFQSKSLSEIYNYKLQHLQHQINEISPNLLSKQTNVFQEDLKNSNYVNLSLSGVDVDNTIGQATLAKQSQINVLSAKYISISSYNLPTGVDNLNTQPSNIFDGKDNTSWLLAYASDLSDYTSLEFTTPKTLVTSLSITPVNAIKIVVLVRTDNIWEQVVDTTLSYKQEFFIYKDNIDSVRVKIRPISGTYPKTCGLKELTIFTNTFNSSGTLYSTELVPQDDFNELNLAWDSEESNDALIKASYSFDPLGPWTLVNNNKWVEVSAVSTNNIQFTSANLSTLPSLQGLYKFTIPNKTSTVFGDLRIGNRQLRVDCYQQDYKELGFKYRIPKLVDFTRTTKFAHQSLPTFGFNTDSVLLQKKGETNIQNALSLGRNGDALVFQRKVDNDVYPLTSDNKYKEMCFVLQSESLTTHIYQYNHHYKFSFYVYSEKEVLYTDANYWFLQGFRTVGNKTFQSLDKTYGTFSMYVNSELVVESDKPKTIFSDNTLETNAINGNKFSFKLKQGLNKIEILASPFDHKDFDPSVYDTNLGPYLQLSITPSLFDENINSLGEFSITEVMAELPTKPKDEFDMLWNFNESPTNWAISSDKTNLLFNYKPLSPIDGYFKGAAINYKFNYKSLTDMIKTPVYVKFDFKASSSKLTPVLKGYTLSLR